MPATLLDYDVTFFRGAKSDSDPGQLPIGYYFSGLNVINQGGVISCRPGYHCTSTLPHGYLQGGQIFKPKIGIEQAVVAIDGKIFVSEWPFREWRQLTELQFSPSAKQLFFGMADQSARRLTDDLGSAIEIFPTRALMIIQDGGETAPAYYDGATGAHLRDVFGTPIGGPMKWIGNRLWVATGSRVRASDIDNPLSFREDIYLGGTAAFSFSREVTALATTPSLEFPQLLVFTESDCSLLQANIQTRDDWPKTVGFQQEVFNVGCSSSRSVVSYYGQLAWYSSAGLVFFDAAVLSKQTARLPIRDTEMAISKTTLHSDLSLVAGAAFGQYVLMSVPAEDIFNRHTWVLNNTSLESLSDGSGASWCGIWTGTRPVSWLYGVIAGSQRIFYFSTDYDGENRLWEAFTPDRLDNGCPITWAAEMRGYFGATTQAQKPPGSDVFFRYAKLAISSIAEDLDLAVFYAGGLRGTYKQILNSHFVAERGNIVFDREFGMDDELFGLKAQSRKPMTQDVSDIPDRPEGCNVEQLDNEDIDECFQLLIVGQGPATLRWVRAYADPKADKDTGNPDMACRDETGTHRVVRFDGMGSKGDTLAAAVLTLPAGMIVYKSNQTGTLRVGSIEAVGAGYSESVISQSAADRVAQRIAMRSAEIEIMSQLPSVLSAGVLDE